MSSLLRSTKFVRYFTGAARTLILNSSKTADANLLSSKAFCASNNVLMRDYATTKKTESLEPLLQRLDSEVRRFGRITKRDIDEIFNEIRTKSDITSSQSLLVIRCCGELVPEELPEQRTLLVQKIWSVLTERGIPMDISHYNALLRVYVENEHPFSPAKFLEELETRGLEPNRVTYQRLMWRYCQEGDIEGATKILERMRELKLPVSEPVLNALVMGHSFHGDTEGAKAVLETMSVAGLQPTNRTYTLLACGYAQKGDISSIESIINTANDKNNFLSNKDILEIIEHLAVGGHGDKIELLFPHLQKSHGYITDLCNHILRLLNKGQEEAAKKIMKTMPKSTSTGNTHYQGAFFVKHLLKVNKSPENVLKTCLELQEEGVVPKALYIAAETALRLNEPEFTRPFLKELQKYGFELRQHYYWPILAHKGREGDEEGLLQVLRDMSSEGFLPTGETLRHYVIPYIINKDTPENVILKLQISNVPAIQSARNVMIELLELGNIKKAADIALQFNLRGHFSLISRPLINALNKTKDTESFIAILHVLSSQPHINSVEGSNDETQKDDIHSKEIGRIVKTAIKNLIQPHLCEQLLVALHSKGLSITTEYAKEIEQFLGENMTTNISELLSKLTSELEMAPVESPRRTSPRNSVELEQLLKKVISKGGNNVYSFQKQLIIAYVKENNVEKLEKHLEDLKSTNFELNILTLAQLFEFYAQNDDIDKAIEYKNQINTKDPSFVFNNYKILQFAYALVRANRFEEAVKFLSENKPSTEDDKVGFMMSSKSWQMLNALAESKDAAKVKEMTKVLIENNYIEPSNVILGPLIKVHLLQNDIEAALNEFEHCCKQYRSTPWKGELMKSLIMKEDATKLQWLADLSTQIHGEVNILHDLALAFIECGRLRQARRILETPGLYKRPKKIEDACQRYVEEGKPEYLEGLLEATKELSYIDRTNIFYHLLVTYCKANETDKALGLWTMLQEDGEIPSNQFLLFLSNHLKSQNREVPFIIPEQQPSIKSTKKKVEDKVATQKMANSQNSKTNVSDTIENMLKNGETTKAVDYTIKSINDGVIPNDKVLNVLLDNLSKDGDVDKIQSLKNILNQSTLKKIKYDDKLTWAMFKRGEAPKYIESLLANLQAASTDDDIQGVIQRFPRNDNLAFIVKNEELLNKYQELVHLAASKGYTSPANLLWMEYILTGKDNEAELIWNQYLRNNTIILYKRLLQESFIRKDPQPIEKVINALKTNKNVTSTSLGFAYSRLINLKILDNKMDEAKIIYENALKSGISKDDINKSTIQRLNANLEQLSQEM